MRRTLKKYILPLLLVILLAGASVAWAESSTGEGHGSVQAVEDTTSGHGMYPGDIHSETAEGESHAEEHEVGTFSRDKLMDLFWRTVNFIALLIILIKFLAKPIGNALAGRQQQVIDELETLKAKRDAAERSYREFESRLAGMEKEMETVVQRAIAQAENEKAKILEDAEKAAEDIKRQAEAAVMAEIVEAKRELRDEIADQAAAMAEELIVKNLKPEDQANIIEQYLDRVGAVQ